MDGIRGRHRSHGRGAERLDSLQIYQEAAGSWRSVRERTGQTLANLHGLAINITDSESFPQNEKARTLEGLRKSMAAILALERETAVRSGACSGVRQALELEGRGIDAELCVDEEVYEAALAKERAVPVRAQDKDPEGYMAKMRQLKQRVAGAGIDRDIQIADERVSAPSRCPVTGSKMERPLIVKGCGHVISTTGVIVLLCQGNQHRIVEELKDVPENLEAKCPNHGCNKKVSVRTVSRDYVTERSQRIAEQSGADQDLADVEELG